MQITLDGLKDTHNRIKTTHNCDDVFGKVMDNVDLLLKNTDIHLIFRVNLTKRNAHEFVYLINICHPDSHHTFIKLEYVQLLLWTEVTVIYQMMRLNISSLTMKMLCLH